MQPLDKLTNINPQRDWNALIQILLYSTLISICGGCFLGCKDSGISDERPNILFIMSDDHTSQAWGVYGGVLENYTYNQNIKRLVREGALLQNVFCTNSICVPSRGAILTGQYSHQNDIYTLNDVLHPDTNNIAISLQQAGYETAVIGKWHLKKEPSGFDYYVVLPGQGRYHDPYLKTKGEVWQDHGKGGKVYEGFSADVIGDQSIQWLESRDNEEPFFLMTHFKATHEPFDYAPRFEDLYDGVEFPYPETLMEFYDDSVSRTFVGQELETLFGRYLADSKRDSLDKRYPHEMFDPIGLSKEEIRKKTYQKFIKDFLRSGAAIDDNIGKILDYLDENGLAENTVVIYTSDQGYFLGEHGFFDKRMIYEEALRMPFVIRYPDEIEGGTINDDIILNIDFPALFADYAGISKPQFVNGRSFRDNVIGDTPTDWRKQMYYRYWQHLQVRPAHFGIRTDRYKLAYFYGEPLDMKGVEKQNTVPAWEFYDLESDPTESNNAYNDPKYASIISNLKKDLAEERMRIGDTDSSYPHLQRALLQ